MAGGAREKCTSPTVQARRTKAFFLFFCQLTCTCLCALTVTLGWCKIPLSYFFATLKKGRYGLAEQRFGRFLLRENKELLRQFLLNALRSLREQLMAPASMARSYFFQKFGLQNSTVLRLTGALNMSTALGLREGKGQRRGESEREEDQTGEKRDRFQKNFAWVLRRGCFCLSLIFFIFLFSFLSFPPNTVDLMPVLAVVVWCGVCD